MADVNKRGSLLISSGALLIAAALLLLCRNLWTAHIAGGRSEEIADLLGAALPDTSYTSSTPDDAGSPEADYPYYVLDPCMDMPVKEIDGAEYIGLLEIDSLALRLPVQSEWSYPNLKISPCRYGGSAYLDSMVICGHNYSTHFGALSELRPGDTVFFTDIDGNRFGYTVAETELLRANAVETMTTGDWDLTLFTCDISGASRVTVRCIRGE